MERGIKMSKGTRETQKNRRKARENRRLKRDYQIIKAIYTVERPGDIAAAAEMCGMKEKSFANRFIALFSEFIDYLDELERGQDESIR